ncbi:MAG: PTS sugar transporter subunit IIA [Deltaproteobacteria bacterium]|nr:PTS sugar transporter subunit IIA [Deltaproteobacteria bacterium]
MRILDVLDKAAVLPNLAGRDKRGVLEEISAAMAPALDSDPERVVQVLLDREKLGSTGIGDGIAIPHGKMRGLSRLHLGFGRSREGIDFDAMDGKPTMLFFVLLAQEGSVGDHLKMLARLSRLLKDADIRKRLLEVETAEEILTIIDEGDASQ